MDLALKAAKLAGLSDARLEQALSFVRDAQAMPDGNDAKREWVVGKLVALGMKESLARLAVELAVAFVKWQQRASA
jgi:hypothetical protein